MFSMYFYYNGKLLWNYHTQCSRAHVLLLSSLERGLWVFSLGCGSCSYWYFYDLLSSPNINLNSGICPAFLAPCSFKSGWDLFAGRSEYQGRYSSRFSPKFLELLLSFSPFSMCISPINLSFISLTFESKSSAYPFKFFISLGSRVAILLLVIRFSFLHSTSPALLFSFKSGLTVNPLVSRTSYLRFQNLPPSSTWRS